MEWIQLVNHALPLLPIGLGYLVGRVLERRHYASLRQRERELQKVLAFSTRYVPEGVTATNGHLVSGSVVVSSDYFKTFVASFRNIFGGQVRGYETLLERARREAMLRLKADAARQGSQLILGVRFHTTRVADSTTPSVEVLAFGTALNCTRPPLL